MKLISLSAEHTMEISARIGSFLQKGDVIALEGTLAAGKTTLTRGIARALAIDEPVTSPTFTLINEYPGRCRLFHCDVYRLNQAAELEDLGFDEYLSGKGVTAVEWAEKIPDALPPDAVWVSFTYEDENRRKIRISGPAQKVRDLLQDISREV